MNQPRTPAARSWNRPLLAPLAALAIALGGCSPGALAVPPADVPQPAAQPTPPAPPPPAPRTFSPAELALRAAPSVVAIRSAGSLGTGFVVRQDGWIATNLHVIAGAQALTVTVPGRGEFPVAEVVVLDREHDLAVVRIDAVGLPALPLADLDRVRAGDPIVAIGHPLGLEGTVSNGLVSAVRHVDASLTVLQISAPIAPGSSGGPLIDDQGRVIGVATAMAARGQNLNFGVPASYLLRALSGASPVPFAEFVKAQLVTAPPPPPRPVPHHELSLLAGCTDDELRLLRAELERALMEGSGPFQKGDYVMTYHVVEGASIGAERRLRPVCAGPRRALAEARRKAERLPAPLAQAWAVHDGLAGVLVVIERKLGQRRGP